MRPHALVLLSFAAIPATVLAATFSGPPAGLTPPAGNVPGLILNFQDSDDPNATQAGAQIRIGASNVQQKLFGNVELSSGGVLGPSLLGSASTTLANIYNKASYPFLLSVRGGLNVDTPVSPGATPDRDGRVQARKFCLNPISGVPDCISAWPTSPDTNAYVQKTGDTMTGTLTVTPGAVANGIVSNGALTAVYGVGTNYGVYGGSSVANGIGVYGYQSNGVGVGGYGKTGASFVGTSEGLLSSGPVGARLSGQGTGLEAFASAGAGVAGQFEAGSGAGLRRVTLAQGNGNAIEATGSILFRSTNNNPNVEILSSGEISAKGPNAGYYFLDRGNASRQFAWYAYNDEARLYHYSSLAGAQNGTFLTVQGVTGNTYNRKNVSTWDVASDARLKDVQGPYARGLDELLQVRTVDYRYKNLPEKNLSSAELRHGVVAQELAKSFPDAVTQGPDGYYAVNTDPVFWAAVNAIQELKAENDARKAENQALTGRIERLEARLAR